VATKKTTKKTVKKAAKKSTKKTAKKIIKKTAISADGTAGNQSVEHTAEIYAVQQDLPVIEKTTQDTTAETTEEISPEQTVDKKLSVDEQISLAKEKQGEDSAIVFAKENALNIIELQKSPMTDLNEIAKDLEISNRGTLRRHHLIFEILKAQTKKVGYIFGEGVLEVLPDGFGFLRMPHYNYLPCPEDIYVSPSQIRRFALKTGDTVAGVFRPPKDKEKYVALLKVETVNSDEPDENKNKILFENLTPLYPEETFRFMKSICVKSTGKNFPAHRLDGIISSCETSNTVKKNNHIAFMFDETFCFCDNHFCNLNVAFRRFIESRTYNFAFNITLHIGNFLRAFVNQQNNKSGLR